MKPPEDWTNAPLLTGAVVSLGLAAWLFAESDNGTLVAAGLLVIGAVLVGALLVDWARRDRDRGPDE